ncbi:FliH/SctL family protein [Erythrobacter sp. W53]|uniref:FliH/SctL family protein n=1 Tax=Erythrobacter sp. W53 TaxID=3425947 RepID=UPI003D7678C3
MANLSDLTAPPSANPAAWIEGFGASRGFIADAGMPGASATLGTQDTHSAEATALEAAYAKGFADGFAEAQAEQSQEVQIGASLRSALGRLDQIAERALRQHLAKTVAGLCEQVIEPELINRAALEKRCADQVHAIGENFKGLSLHIHPSDLDLLSEEIQAAMPIRTDPALTRGSLQISGKDGAMRDGPDEWRRTIAEALAQ